MYYGIEGLKKTPALTFPSLMLSPESAGSGSSLSERETSKKKWGPLIPKAGMGYGATGIAAGWQQGIGMAAGLAGGALSQNKDTELLGSAVQGAGAGMMFGPWGAAIGGAAGLGMGLINQSRDLKEQARQNDMKRVGQQASAWYSKEQQPYDTTGYYQMKDGGEVRYKMTPKQNMMMGKKKLFSLGGEQIEAEGQETLMYPNGKMENINGPSHEQGGVPMTVKPGSKIFSNRIKARKELIERLKNY
jgi:hypothetical protein